MEIENDFSQLNQEAINFHTTRDFGDLLGAPFSFLKQEFKLLSKALLFFSAPFVVLGMILMGFMGNLIMENVGSSKFGDSIVVQIFVFIGLFLLLLFVAYSMTNAVIHNYTALYVKKGKGNFNLEDIWAGIKSNFFKLFFQQFAITLAVIIGTLFFYVPGIYLQTALSFVYIISVYEKIPFGKAVSRSFQIIKDNWWLTFLLTMVVGMILGFISYIFIIPLYVIIFVASAMNEFSSIMLIVSLLSALLFFLFEIYVYAIQQLTSNFQYFSLMEQKESPALLQRINAMKPTETTLNKNDFSFSAEKNVQNNRLSPEENNNPTNNNSFWKTNEDENENDRFRPK